jgi:hypothetical protein
LRPVRCIDCSSKKTCDRVRVNKYAKKPCGDYVPDLNRIGNIRDEKIKLGKN